MQRAKNEKLKKQYVDKMLLFLNNKYSRMFKDKKITNEKLRKDIEKMLGNQNFKNFDYQSNLKTVEKSILAKASKIGQIKYQPVQMSKINDLLNFDKDKYLTDEPEKQKENIQKVNNTNDNTKKTVKNKSKEKNIKTNLDKDKIKNKEKEINQEQKKIENNPEEKKTSQIRPQSAVVNYQKVNEFNLNNNIVSNNNFSIYNENNNMNAMSNLSEKMRKLKLKEQDEWAIKAKLDHDNYIKEQNDKKKELYEKQMKQRELLENQIKEKKEREEKLYNDNFKNKYKYFKRDVGENELNNNLNNNYKKNNNINNNIEDNINYKPNNKLSQIQNDYNGTKEKNIQTNFEYNNNIDSNRIEEIYSNIINNKNILNNNIPNYNQLNNNVENNIYNNNPIMNNNNINNNQMNFNNNITNNIPQNNNEQQKMNFIPPNINNFSQNPLTTNSSIPQELIYQNNQFLLQNQQSNISLPPYNYQYNSQYQYPLNKNIPNTQSMNNNNPLMDCQNNLNNIKLEQNNPNPSLNVYNNDIPNINQDQNPNQTPYPQELTNRNQFSDYDFRKKSGGDINQYYNEIRMRKQQIRDQYKQIEQENYLNAQKKKEEKKIEKEREKLLKLEMNEPSEEMSNLLLRQKKLKEKNLIDQIDFTREVRNNEELLKFEKQKKMEDFRKTLDEQVNQKKKMQQIKDMINNQEKKQDLYEMNQQFLEDVKNIQNRYEDKQEIFMMNNIIGNNNNFNDYD